MGQYNSETQRPQTFTLNQHSVVAQGAACAGLGRFRGSTRYQDSSPYGYHGTLTNMDPATDWGVSETLGRNCLTFAQSDLVTVPYKLPLYPGLRFSFALWVNSSVTDYTSSGYAIGQYTTGGDARQWALRVNATGDVFGIVVSADGTSLTVASADASQAVQTGWHHVAVNVTRTDAANPSYWDFYYDGVFKQQLTVTKGFVNRSAALDIGGITGNANSWLGKIADPIYYPQQHLTSSVIRHLADPSNVMLSGWIQPLQRKWWPVIASSSTPVPVFMNQYRQRVA